MLAVTAYPGSSPLARGLPARLTLHAGPCRIIPARAGFTGLSRGPAYAPRDHPRSRGVYGEGEGVAGAGVRIIPARAGFTVQAAQLTGETADHPRSRGVYGGSMAVTRPPTGSSPLARGLRPAGSCAISDQGIIPARAGFTGWSRRGRRRWGDHPRSRGVYSLRWAHLSCDPGSSPLARGLPTAGLSPTGKSGIIPARAGFTFGHDGHGAVAQDHPRSRGVYPRKRGG